MSLRKTGKLLTLVGFVICLSCMGILYGNLATIVEERDQLASKSSLNELQFKRDVEAKELSISTLEAKLSRALEASQSCTAVKNAMDERNTGLMTSVESYKALLENSKAALQKLERDKNSEIAELKSHQEAQELKHKGAISTLKQTIESNTGCESSAEALQTQLTLAKEQIHVLETQLATCAQVENNRNNIAEEELNDSDADEGNNIIPVAAVPKAAAEPGIPGGGGIDMVPVAALPNQHDSGNPVDNKLEIPEAQAPAPLPVQEQPVIPGDNEDAIVPAPLQPAPRDTRDVEQEEEEEDEEDEDEEERDGIEDNMLEPLQPISDDLLAESLEKMQQEEQLQHLQERQQQQQILLPIVEDNNNPEHV